MSHPTASPQIPSLSFEERTDRMRKVLGIGPGGGGYSIYPWVGRCSSAPHTLTLFKTKIADFPTLLRQNSDF